MATISWHSATTRPQDVSAPPAGLALRIGHPVQPQRLHLLAPRRGDDKAAAVVGGQLVVQERLEGLEHLVGLGLAGPQKLPERTGTEVECAEQKHLGPMGVHSNTGRCDRYHSFRPRFEAHRALLTPIPGKSPSG